MTVWPVSYTHLDVYKRQTKHPMHPQNASVELKSVHFSYDGEKEVLTVSYTHLDVYKRQVFALIRVRKHWWDDITQGKQ